MSSLLPALALLAIAAISCVHAVVVPLNISKATPAVLASACTNQGSRHVCYPVSGRSWLCGRLRDRNLLQKRHWALRLQTSACGWSADACCVALRAAVVQGVVDRHQATPAPQMENDGGRHYIVCGDKPKVQRCPSGERRGFAAGGGQQLPPGERPQQGGAGWLLGQELAGGRGRPPGSRADRQRQRPRWPVDRLTCPAAPHAGRLFDYVARKCLPAKLAQPCPVRGSRGDVEGSCRSPRGARQRHPCSRRCPCVSATSKGHMGVCILLPLGAASARAAWTLACLFVVVGRSPTHRCDSRPSGSALQPATWPRARCCHHWQTSPAVALPPHLPAFPSTSFTTPQSRPARPWAAPMACSASPAT